jgi:hypothetical protein
MSSRQNDPVLMAMLLATLNMQALGQGTFQNLDFESATLVPIPGDPYGRVEFAPAFPGWTGYIGTNVQTVADYNSRSLSEPGIAIMDTDYPSAGLFQGKYYARLYLSYPGPPISAALAQSGTVPPSAQSIRFYASSFDVPFVSFAGQAIPVLALQSTSTYTVFGGDISAFAGQMGELKFQGSLTFDNIFFSNEPIPEPSAVGLFGLGALLLGCLFRRRLKL